MPETKAYSHSQGLGFCGKVQAGQEVGWQRNAKQRHSSHGLTDVNTH